MKLLISLIAIGALLAEEKKPLVKPSDAHQIRFLNIKNRFAEARLTLVDQEKQIKELADKNVAKVRADFEQTANAINEEFAALAKELEAAGCKTAPTKDGLGPCEKPEAAKK